MSLNLPRALLRGLAAVALVAASQASAADLALVLSNSDYRRLDDTPDAEALRPVARQLERQGFEVVTAFDGRTDTMIEAADQFRRLAEDADRILILLDGHFASTRSDAWLLSTDARDRLSDLTVPSQGLSLSSLADIAGRAAAGRAVILTGRSSELTRPGAGLRSGVQGVELPQGVTLARGPVTQIRSAIFDGLLSPGTSLNEALGQLSARGFLTDSVSYSVATRGPVFDTDALTEEALDEGFWNAVRAIDTVPAIELYLNRYPNGRFRGQARERISAIETTTRDRWEQAERDLGLRREDRRQIQRDLTELGYSTRGVDGIFGQGSRSAIGRWQRDRSHRVTGFLTRPQWRQITSEATARREEKQAEAARVEERYWQQTGASGEADGLRAYLDRYPDGRYSDQAKRRLSEITAEDRRRDMRRAWRLAQEADTIRAYRSFLESYGNSQFAGQARTRLTALEAARKDQVNRAARRAWQQAQDANTFLAYRDFLKQYGNTEFANQARARLRDLQAGDDANSRFEAAKREEREVAGNPVTRLLVERRLQSLGYKPGPVEGNFDRQTRRALRAYQKDRGILQSGYVTKRTAAFLLAGQ